MKTDRFAEIAAEKSNTKKDVLSENKPISHEKKICLLNDDKEALVIPKRMDTKEELYNELESKRQEYKEFLKDYAPKIKECTKVINIKKFILDGEEEIEIPHYGGPLGNAVLNYEAEFEISDDLKDKAVYICFGGADYIASVYINGCCVGIHEGFFSPFEYEIGKVIKKGKNKLRVELKNDYIYMGNYEQNRICGDKLYAATGLGYDDPELGWHHCPPGMGVYNYVRVEIRNRMSITDIYVRPLIDKKKAEVWVEVENADYLKKSTNFSISVYGQNFKEEVIKDYNYTPYLGFKRNGDSERYVGNETDFSGTKSELLAQHGKNQYKIMLDFDSLKLWDINTPYLYQVQVSMYSDGVLEDVKKQQFGMRSFVQDTKSSPKGMFYLNGRKIRLRGANTMGFEQQDVLREDFEQLIDDILLAKICNMNFLRLTQRPVQDEVYEYCDKLGLMTQTDLPLFACMRRTMFAEGIRQAEEMIKMVRKHPCNIVVSYINEPQKNGYNMPHRNLERDELETFFASCDYVVKLNSPDSVIKHVDGDYDPPSFDSMPDNHCYNLWYNAHEIDFGKLYRGYWINTQKDWYYGCGEFGAEGLDFRDLMERKYPKAWLKEPFNPKNIIRAQSEIFHGCFFDTPEGIDEWVEKSQKHQEFAVKNMTEIFRRDPRMVSNAIHLFIDAWPSGWMKAIMDCERNPKPAYFAYKNALEPLLISMRSDRFTYFEGEKISIETYISNDFDKEFKDLNVHFELYSGNEKVKGTKLKCGASACDVTYVANAEFCIDDVKNREKFRLRAILSDKEKVLSFNDFEFEVFEDVEIPENDNVVWVNLTENGEFEIAGEKVSVCKTWHEERHFVSKRTGHKAVCDFLDNDFKYWYDEKEDRITPLVSKAFSASGFSPVLVCRNCDER